MAKGWMALKTLDDEESRRLYKKKAAVAVVLQTAIEQIMDIFLGNGSWGDAAPALRDIETIWQVLGLEYVQASERNRLEREEGKDE